MNARKKGHNYELEIAQKFREHGFPDCVTSRSESKRLDDAGVDLCFTGSWMIQAKAWEAAPSYHTVLSKMPKGGRNAVFHKRNRKGTVVVISEELFWELLDTYEKELKR